MIEEEKKKIPGMRGWRKDPPDCLQRRLVQTGTRRRHSHGRRWLTSEGWVAAAPVAVAEA
jgi:hypothetical protein